MERKPAGKTLTIPRQPPAGRVVALQGIRKENIPYLVVWLVYYAWVVAFSTWWAASPQMIYAFGTQMRSLMHIVNLLSSAVCVYLIRREHAVKIARVGAVALLISMGALLVTKGALLQTALSVLMGIGMGVVNIGILAPYIFTLNNTEKLYAMIGSNVLICLISLALESRMGQALSLLQQRLVSAAILIAGLVGIWLFEQGKVTRSVEENAANAPVFHPKLYITLVISCIFAVLYKGIGKGMLDIAMNNSPLPVSVMYHAGGLVGALIYLVVFAKVKNSLHVVINLSFSLLSLGLLCNALSDRAPALVAVFALMLGVGNTIGVATMYYMLGVIGKKYNSMRYIQRTILLVGICGGVAGVIAGNMILSMQTVAIAISMSVAAVMLTLLTLSPLLTNYHPQAWMLDTEKTEIDNEQLQLFLQYRLSRREIDVCKLLLQGYTMRQISAILSLAYPTVNTYCTSAYRKLNINSRTELMVMFKDYML